MSATPLVITTTFLNSNVSAKNAATIRSQTYNVPVESKVFLVYSRYSQYKLLLICTVRISLMSAMQDTRHMYILSIHIRVNIFGTE